jgi:hypothetical protein
MPTSSDPGGSSSPPSALRGGDASARARTGAAIRTLALNLLNRVVASGGWAHSSDSSDPNHRGATTWSGEGSGEGSAAVLNVASAPLGAFPSSPSKVMYLVHFAIVDTAYWCGQIEPSMTSLDGQLTPLRDNYVIARDALKEATPAACAPPADCVVDSTDSSTSGTAAEDASVVKDVVENIQLEASRIDRILPILEVRHAPPSCLF